jgi:hypothetical protein
MLSQGLVHLVADAHCVSSPLRFQQDNRGKFRPMADGSIGEALDGRCGEIVTTFENKIARGDVYIACSAGGGGGGGGGSSSSSSSSSSGSGSSGGSGSGSGSSGGGSGGSSGSQQINATGGFPSAVPAASGTTRTTSIERVPSGAVRKVYRDCDWVWHNGTGYILPPGEAVMVTNGVEPLPPPPSAVPTATVASSHTGDTAADRGMPRVHDDVITGGGLSKRSSLFSLAVSHNASSSSSSCVAVPGVTLADMPSIAAASNLTIAANRPGIQAVYDASSVRPKLLAVIWQAGVQHALNSSSNQVHVPHAYLCLAQGVYYALRH